MGGFKNSVGFVKLNRYNFHKFKRDLVGLYIHSFSTGDYSQYTDSEVAGTILDNYFNSGCGIAAFVDDDLAGLIVAVSFSLDSEFPEDISFFSDRDKSLYIAEVMVHNDYRGNGLATMLVEKILSDAAKIFDDAVIRVWDKNLPALNLYIKLGFKNIASIKQEKLSLDGESFEMNKIYLHKKLTSKRSV